ncbi:porin family protein [Polaribacter sp. Z014]|uniref:hypothetical protein n=1 Tax=unclassified Polaribacter TaxID=196858 RepID=UPI00193B84B6|nr:MULTISPECIES: hypothetical protein [unclassified Polaribacter]MCL7763342.1 porin family protein [Polaribacter sp. Z014]QVY67288.1 hypothetical protein JOP69_08480 [Polaribacter sp. Q13]
MKKNTLIIVLTFISFIATAQEENFKHFRVSPVLSHTFIPTSTSDGDKVVIVPSFGLDLEYWINEKWGLGLHNDLELETFEIEKEHEIFVEKEHPVVLTLDALHKFHENWVLVLGAGVELEKQENLFIVRAGLEYEIEFGNNWDVSPTVLYDYRANNLDTWAIGIGIGKRF